MTVSTSYSAASTLPASGNLRLLAYFGLAYALVLAMLASTGASLFEDLHLALDVANGMLSLLLAVFLLAEQHRMPAQMRAWLALAFGMAACTEILHALVGVEWLGVMAWVSDYAHTLRPATWPPSAYLLPLGLAWIHLLKRRESQLSSARFMLGLGAIALLLFALALNLPKYVDTGILGIQRPTQAPLMVLLALVISAYWRQRREHPLYEGIALMCVLLLVSDLFMLYSTSPHEKFTMMAHAGKFFAYTFLHTLQMRVAAEDSRARARAEAALQAETERLHDALDELGLQKYAMDQHAIVAVTDAEERITYVNDAFCKISGYRREELMGNSHRMISSGVHPSAFFAALYAAIKHGKVWHGEICNRAKDGSHYWLQTTIVPFVGTDGAVLRYITIRTDITRQKTIEAELQWGRDHLEAQVAERTAELRQAKESAEAASQAKSVFLANISHELRTPMHAVMGMTALALRRAEDLKQRDHLSKVDVAARHLLRVIDDILDISEIESQRLTLKQENLRLADVVAELLAKVEPLAAKKSVPLVLDLPAPLAQLPLAGDADRLRQVLFNLVDNALKFTRQGCVSIGVRLLDESADAVRVRFEVADSGIGIAPEQQMRLFTAFEQLDNSLTRKYGGTGLGLAISQNLVKAMDGSIGVTSVLGEGSTFWFIVRLLREPPADTSAQADQDEPTPLSAQPRLDQ